MTIQDATLWTGADLNDALDASIDPNYPLTRAVIYANVHGYEVCFSREAFRCKCAPICDHVCYLYGAGLSVEETSLADNTRGKRRFTHITPARSAAEPLDAIQRKLAPYAKKAGGAA